MLVLFALSFAQIIILREYFLPGFWQTSSESVGLYYALYIYIYMYV